MHRESLTWDEDDHLFAGFMSLRTGDFGLNPEHPPMAKMVAALPLLPLHLRVPPLGHRFFKDESYLDGRDMLFGNEPRFSGETLLFRARLAMMIFPLALALILFFAARDLFDDATALCALSLLAFEPNLLTHGPFVTTDTAITATSLATVWTVYRYVRRPSLPRLLLAGLCMGLALAAKHSGLVLLVALVPLLGGELWLRARERRARMPIARGTIAQDAVKLSGALVSITLIALLVLWSFYGFRYAARPAGLHLSPDLAHYVVPLRPIEAGGILLLGRLHIFPESWLYGLADVRLVANAMPTYFFGKIYAHGIWLYFPAVLLIKLTLGSLLLTALAVFATLRGWVGGPRELWFVLFPATIYFLIASGSGLNIGARHILPCIPSLLLFAAAGAVALARRSRAGAVIVAALLLAHAASSASAFPRYLPYANEAWGGPRNTGRYLSDSNVDWGQQLLQVKSWLDAHPESHAGAQAGTQPCYFAYFVTPFVLPSNYGIDCVLLPTLDSSNQMDIDMPRDVHGTLIISQADVNGFEFGTKVRNPYQSLFGRQPDALIEDAVYVFHGTFDLPDAAAIAPTQRATRALKANRPGEAIAEAGKALALSPDNFDALMILAEAQTANHDNSAAQGTYALALKRVGDMEPSAQVVWRKQIAKEIPAR